MIRICRSVYISPLTIVLFVLCWLNRTLGSAALAYAIMTVHELFHLAAAKLLGLGVSYIALQPFGLNLKLKNKYLLTFSDEVILYLAGPLANILMALTASALATMGFERARLDYFYTYNLALFAMNMLPVLPLDGGVVLKKLLAYKLGAKRALFVMRAATCFFIGLFLFAAIYTVNTDGVNYSLICMVIFLTGNLLTQKEKYNTDFLKELVYGKSKTLCGRRAVIRVAREGEDLRRRAAEFAVGTYTVLLIVDDTGAVKDVITEQQVIHEIINKK